MQLFFAGGEEQELGMAAAGRSTLSRLHWLGGGGGRGNRGWCKRKGVVYLVLHCI